MKVIVAGSRSINDKVVVWNAIEHAPFTITELVSGAEPHGVDRLGEQWARRHMIPIRPVPADWARFGIKAGPIRNTEMARYADALILVWDGRSAGSADMRAKARARNLPIHEYVVPGRIGQEVL